MIIIIIYKSMNCFYCPKKCASLSNLCPKLLYLENLFEFIWNLKSMFEIWKVNLVTCSWHQKTKSLIHQFANLFVISLAKISFFWCVILILFRKKSAIKSCKRCISFFIDFEVKVCPPLRSVSRILPSINPWPHLLVGNGIVKSC